MYDIGGVNSFYSASALAVLSQIISMSSKYSIYKMLDHRCERGNKFINGFISGLLSSLITHPMDVFKINRQINRKIFPLIRAQGYRFIYRGFSKTIIKSCIGSSLCFPLYDYYYQRFNNIIVASILSSFSATVITHPIDLLKTRSISGKKLFIGWNPAKYYRGLSLNLLRIIPNFIIFMKVINILEAFS